MSTILFYQEWLPDYTIVPISQLLSVEPLNVAKLVPGLTLKTSKGVNKVTLLATACICSFFAQRRCVIPNVLIYPVDFCRGKIMPSYREDPFTFKGSKTWSESCLWRLRQLLENHLLSRDCVLSVHFVATKFAWLLFVLKCVQFAPYLHCVAEVHV